MDSFLAGVAVRDITPDPGAPLWGYSGRSGPATGALDPLYAKAAVFRAGGETVALVALDLGRVPLEAACNRIRARVKRAGVAHVMLAATHTHHGPVMEMEDAPHTPAIEQTIGECIEEAAAALQPVRIGVGRAELDIAHNRRKILKNGHCAMLWRNEERVPTEPVDKEAVIIRLDTEAGKPLAALVHYACHPVIMGPSNLEYSADYVGELARVVQEASGAQCLFLQGGCGDINPYLDKTSLEQEGVAAMRAEGQACGQAVLAALTTIQTEAPQTPSVAFRETAVRVGIRWDFSDPEQARMWGASHPALFQAYQDRITPGLAVPLTVLVLNRAIAFAGMPGEFFTDSQLDLKKQSPLPCSLLVGYANDYHAYFPTLRHAAAGGYGGTVGSYVGLGAGEKLVSRAAIEIGNLSGKFRPRCTAEDFVVLDAADFPD